MPLAVTWPAQLLSPVAPSCGSIFVPLFAPFGLSAARPPMWGWHRRHAPPASDERSIGHGGAEPRRPVPRSRSRSPVARPELGPLRPGAPGRRGDRPAAALPRWRGPGHQAEAAEALQQDTLAPGTRASTQAKLHTVTRALAGWGLTPFPPSVEKIFALGATLKEGHYRSASSYIVTYKVEAQRLGYSWGDPLHRALKDVTRSCERGLGPPLRAQPLPFDQLARLPADH